MVKQLNQSYLQSACNAKAWTEAKIPPESTFLSIYFDVTWYTEIFFFGILISKYNHKSQFQMLGMMDSWIYQDKTKFW